MSSLGCCQETPGSSGDRPRRRRPAGCQRGLGTKETARLNEIVEQKQKPIAWIEKGHLQNAFILTSDYGDRVYHNNKCEMCYYYVCLHTHGNSRAEVRAALAESPPRVIDEGSIPPRVQHVHALEHLAEEERRPDTATAAVVL